MEAYSVLMSVYHREDPRFLAQAIQSMMDQTVVTDDFVIVCDGPLTPELDGVLEEFNRKYPGIFNIIRLEKNVGIGAAVNTGLRQCKNDLVAKMDADDISAPNRCEDQLSKFAENSELTVLGGIIEEFSEDPAKPFAVRSVPETNEAIRKFARRRQPFNNVTVMYRRSAVLSVGGYRDFRRNEDYDMYVRLLHAGHYAENLPQTLVQVRVDNSACARRASIDTLKGCARSRWNAFRIGYSSLWDVMICVAGEALIVFSPGPVQQFVYSHFLRKNCKN